MPVETFHNVRTITHNGLSRDKGKFKPQLKQGPNVRSTTIGNIAEDVKRNPGTHGRQEVIQEAAAPTRYRRLIIGLYCDGSEGLSQMAMGLTNPMMS